MTCHELSARLVDVDSITHVILSPCHRCYWRCRWW